MRLGQLSRQLDVSTEKISKLLNDNFREVSSHPNVKLTEEELFFVKSKLGPISETNPEPVVEVQAPEIEKKQDDSITEAAEKSEDKKKIPEFIEELRPQVITLEDEFLAQTDGLEVYKAEKPHLEGLKVVGKIELPEPLVKEKSEDEAKKEVRKIRDRKTNRREDARRRSGSSGSSLVEERKKAERLAKKKKFEDEKKLRELKKKHYDQNVKAKIVKSPPKKKKKPVPATVTHSAPNTSTVKQRIPSKKATPKSTNLLKRFWLWLNGAYDK